MWLEHTKLPWAAQVGNFAFWLDSLLVAVLAEYGARAFYQVRLL